MSSLGKFIQQSSPNWDVLMKVYVAKHNPYVCILTPSYGGTCYISFFHSLIVTMEAFRKYDIRYTIDFCKNDSLVSRARNNLVAKAMARKETTHILFIDSDITWTAADVFKLLLADKFIIGGIYPLKKYYWDRLVENGKNNTFVKDCIEKRDSNGLKNVVSDEEIIQNNLLRYNVNYSGTTLQIENNLAKVKHVATGFMMIKRSAIERMSRQFPDTKYEDDVGFLTGDENKYAYALFDCGVEEGHYFSEDWMFCHRWTNMGGNVYLDVTINLTHTGVEDFKGSYITSIMS